VLFTKYYLADKSRRMRWAGHVARVGEMQGVCRVLVGKTDGRRLLGIRRNRGEDDVMDLKEIGCEDKDWFHLVQNRGVRLL
jgi:hypothetical protein